MAADEPAVFPTTPMPRGYTFVRKGNVYVTAHCRRATHAAGRTVYVVVQKSSPSSSSAVLGLRCPVAIVEAVREAERDSRAARKGATQKRDAALADTFRDALRQAYPAVPPQTVPEIVQHALAKHERRVARTSTLALAARVRLAVRAHIRHRCTNYENLLAGGIGSEKKGDKKEKATKGVPREEARALTVGRVDAIERQWAGKAVEEKKEKKEKGMKDKKGKSGKGEGITARGTTVDKGNKGVARGKANKGDRVQKAQTEMATRSCKSEATARIARYTRRWETAGSDREAAILIDSDSDWTE